MKHQYRYGQIGQDTITNKLTPIINWENDIVECDLTSQCRIGFIHQHMSDACLFRNFGAT